MRDLLKTMTIITIDDELINEIIAVSQYENAQEAVIKILSNYLQQQKKSSELLVDIVNDLPEFPTFKNQNPLTLQTELRDEWD